jgi:TolB-like protein
MPTPLDLVRGSSHDRNTVAPVRSSLPGPAGSHEIAPKSREAFQPALDQEMAKTYILGRFRIDAEASILFRGAEPVALGQRAVALLRALVEQPRIPVSKDALIAAAWPGLTVEESNLTVQISALRRVFGEEPGCENWIETLPRRGYRFIGPVSVKDEGDTVGAPQVSNVPTTTGAPGLTPPIHPSIAVLPFQNMSGDPEQDYFADGIVEEIITALSRFRQLFVIARNSSFTYKGRAIEVKQVGRELGVDYVLEGSVRRASNRIRIAGQLIDATTGTHLWADRFDGRVQDIFDLQDQMTAQVVAAIAPKLEEAEIERAKRKHTESLDAYDQFLRGLAGFHQWSKEGNDQGLQHFYKAIELDSNYAAAYGMAVRMYVQRNAGGWVRDRSYEVAETERLAMRAAELGHDDAVALATAGWALSDFLGQFEGGDAMIDRAISLNPNLAWVWLASSWVKTSLGEPEIALERIEQALRLSPNDPQTASFHAAKSFAQVFAGRFADAYSSAQAAIRRRPGFLYYLYIAAVSAALEGRMDDARRTVTRILQINPALRISDASAATPMRRPEDTARWVDALKKAGLPE